MVDISRIEKVEEFLLKLQKQILVIERKVIENTSRIINVEEKSIGDINGVENLRIISRWLLPKIESQEKLRNR